MNRGRKYKIYFFKINSGFIKQLLFVKINQNKYTCKKYDRPLLRLFVWLAFINSTLDILIKDSNLAFGVNIRYIVRCTISKPEVNTSISSDRGTNLFKPPQFSLYKETMTYMYKRKKIK